MNSYTIWIYWFMTDVMLAIGLMLEPAALYFAMLLVVVHSLHFLRRTPKIAAFPMQVRLVYLGLLILGQVPYFRWVNWIQLVGTTVLLTLNYCPLARMLSLTPWNRSQPLSWKFVVAALCSKPVKGSIIQVTSPDLVARLHPEIK